jgi:1,2-diacylglycerol 3-alpha-glucosyltransferase
MWADSFYPTIDGAVIAMERQAKGLEDRGHEIVIIAPDTPDRQETHWRVHYLPSIEFRRYPGYRIVVSPGDMLEFLRHERADILHCHGLASMAILSLTAGRAMDIPHVLTFHTMANEAVKHYSSIPIREDLVVPMSWIYLRNMMRRPELVIAPTAPIRDELIANGVKMKACEVVPTGVDCKRFSPENYEKGFLARYGLEGRRVLLHVGRLSVEKRLDIVLKAMAELGKEEPDLRLLVSGKGPAADQYAKMAKDLGISDRVVFAGFIPDDELARAYASCEMLIIASTFETQGLVVLEALASGTPVVGMRHRAIPEFVKEGKNGCLFDETTCADAIRRCLGRSGSMKMDAVASAREYSVESCTEQLERAYAKATEILRATHK